MRTTIACRHLVALEPYTAWINGFDLDKSGSSWFVTGQDREGVKGVAQGTIYRVKGL